MSCDDHNPCNGVETCDLETYSCVTGTVPPENVPCDDGLACTEDDRCRSHECKGVARSCDDGLPCSVDSCDEAVGGCVSDTSACACTGGDGDCPDANLCDGASFCDTGANTCAPGTPVTCEPPTNACKRASCVTTTGACAILDKDDGTPCDDGSVCTTTDTCQAGTCTGFAPVTCQPSNSCHEAVGCDPTLGCLEAPRPDGTPCQTPLAEDGSCKSGGCKRLPIVVAGGDHTCAILSDDSLRCWGRNDQGQLGLGHTDDVGGANALPVIDAPAILAQVRSVGLATLKTCAVLIGGDVRCWGPNYNGDLGYGDLVPRGASPTTVPLLLQPVPIGAPARSTSVRSGHACVLTTLDNVRCWGTIVIGIPGSGPGVGTPTDPTAADLGNVPVGLPAIRLATTEDVTCALFGNGKLRCWGGASAVLGLGDPSVVGAIGDDEAPSSAPYLNPT